MRIALFGSCLLIVGCSAAGSTNVQVRLLDDITVMSPADVLAMRSTIPEGLEVSSNQGPGTSGQEIESSGAEDGSSDENDQSDSTVPQNVDDRPAELKLFEAYANFKSCIEDAGETIRGTCRIRPIRHFRTRRTQSSFRPVRPVARSSTHSEKQLRHEEICHPTRFVLETKPSSRCQSA